MQNPVKIRPPFIQWGGHLQSIYPSLFRAVPIVYERERLELEDGDFLDLDWHKVGSKKLIIVTHGLEGDSTRPYVTALIKLFSQQGIDGLGWNCRSCSGEINRLPRFYHHGDAEDLRTVVEHAIRLGYDSIFLSGCSMGGSLTLRLLGEHPERLPKEVMGAFVGSVPLDIYSSVRELDRPYKRFYMNRFLRKLKAKLMIKEQMFPGNELVSCRDFVHIKNFVDFDGRYTAPIHGYRSAFDFYEKASTKPLLHRVQVPTMIVQSLNDPFLGPECYEPSDNPLIQFILTRNGGHVGFMVQGQEYTWTEKKALEFFQSLL
ncbi:YheT family hydrolase [Leadbetterella byssophila]|uniref:YheT family hydrolase n=1 Tax=Leadbetterella byssophila TaxID=316068 RepID=UPI0039A09B37